MTERNQGTIYNSYVHDPLSNRAEGNPLESKEIDGKLDEELLRKMNIKPPGTRRR